MASKTRPMPDDIDIVSLFGAVRRGLRSLLIATVVVAGATFGVLSAIAPRYASETQLSISVKRTNPFPDKREGSDAIAPRLDKEAINTHVRSLMAPDLVRDVAGQLNLKSRPEFNSVLGPIDLWSRVLRMMGFGGPARGESDEERVLRVIYDQLEVSAAHESRFLSVKFHSADPALAAEFANRLAKSYRDGLVSMPVNETSQMVSALQPKVDQLRREVIAAESRVERFRAETDQFRGGAQSTPINDQRMAALTDELTRAETAKSEAESRLQTARELSRAASADVLPEVQKSPLIQNLISQRVNVEREQSEAAASLLPDHPRMRQINANLKQLKLQIDVEVRKVVEGLEKDFRAASLRAKAAASQIAALKSTVVKTSGNEAELRALESEVNSKKTELERLQKQLEDSRTIVNIKQVPVEAQIVSLARASAVPIFPKKGPYTLLAMAATFLLGLAWIIFRELVSGAYGTGKESRVGRPAAHTVSPVLPIETAEPVLPDVPGRERLAGDRPIHTLASIASRIAAREGVTSGYRTLITGAFPGGGDEHPALQLASQLAGRGQTALVIDWDLSGRGSLTASSGMPSPGISDLLTGAARFEDVIRQIPGGSIQFIGPGSKVDDLDGLLEPSQLNLILDVLDEAYDQVITTGNVSDARRLFEAIEGRVDAGIRVLGRDGEGQQDGAGNFLGYDVEGIEIFDYYPPGRPESSRPQLKEKKVSGFLRRA